MSANHYKPFADDHAHLTAIAAANGGCGFPFVSQDSVSLDPRPLVGLKAILLGVAARNGISVHEILSPSRYRYVAWPRQEFMWAARQVKWANGQHRYSLPAIAEFLGLKDHTTVLHGVKAYQKRLDHEAEADRAKWQRLGGRRMTLDERIKLAGQIAGHASMWALSAPLADDRGEMRERPVKAFCSHALACRQFAELQTLAPNCASEGFERAARVTDFVEARAG